MPDSNRGPQPSNPGAAPAQAKDQAKQAVGQVQEAAKPYVDQAKQAVGQAQEAAKPYLDQAKEHYDNAREGALKGYRQAEGAIARNPAPAVLIGFGVGFGLGFVICSLLASQKEETWAEKYLPDSLKNVPDQAGALAGKLKKQVPDKYESLLETLKDLPSSVAAQLPRSISKFLG